MDNFQNALVSLSADSFTDEKPTQKEELSLIVHLDNENCPQVSIRLYRYDGTNCLAVVDGTPVSLVGRGITLNILKDQLYSLNMRMRLAMQNHNEEEQEALRKEMAEVQEEIDCMGAGGGYRR